MEPRVLLLGEVDMGTRWVFCRKFKSQQPLFGAFLHIICIFVSIEPWSESTFLFRNIIIFQTWQSLQCPSSAPREIDMYIHWVFCRKFNCQQLLFKAFFHIIGIFCSVRPWKSTFPFIYINNLDRKWCMSALRFSGALVRPFVFWWFFINQIDPFDRKCRLALLPQRHPYVATMISNSYQHNWCRTKTDAVLLQLGAKIACLVGNLASSWSEEYGTK